MKQCVAVLIAALMCWQSSSLAQNTEYSYQSGAQAYQMQSYAQAEEIWSQLALDGNANAQYALAIMHLKRETQNPDDEIAFYLLQNAATQQHVAAMFNLGVAYWEGTGTEVSQREASNWWEIAARKQDIGAQYNLGLAYFIGAGRSEDPEKAHYWVKQAAENGHPQAPALLVSMGAPQPAESQSDNPPAKQPQSILEPELKPTLAAPRLPVAAAPSNPAPRPEIKPSPPVDIQIPAADQPLFWKTINAITQLHSQASTDSPALAVLKPGTLVQLLETKGNWASVHSPKPLIAWVQESYLSDTRGDAALIRGDRVNIRPSPSTKANAAPITQLDTGDQVRVLLKRGAWVQIAVYKPVPAWIQLQSLQQYRSNVEERREAWTEQTNSG